MQGLRSGVVEHWLRRILGDVQLATRVEELVHHRSLDMTPGDGRDDAELLMRAVALIDPLAPLCWRGVALWPDGIGPALAVAQAKAPETLGRLQEIVRGRKSRTGRPSAQTDAMPQCCGRMRDSNTVGCGSLARGRRAASLVYQLNPLLPCASPLLAKHWVDRLPDLLPALEDVAGE